VQIQSEWSHADAAASITEQFVTHQAIGILAMLPEDPELALRILERAVEILEQLDRMRPP
jgi:hypothetical protein